MVYVCFVFIVRVFINNSMKENQNRLFHQLCLEKTSESVRITSHTGWKSALNYIYSRQVTGLHDFFGVYFIQ